MKYVWSALAVVAAIAALWFRPPRDAAKPLALDPPAGDAAPRAAAAGSRDRASSGRRDTGAVLTVYVAGEVRRPGVYRFAPGARAQDALALAGGPQADADLVAVNLAAPLDDGAEVAFPRIGESAAPHRARQPRSRSTHGSRRHSRHRRAAGAGPSGGLPDAPAPATVDLNTADAPELESLPGVGPAIAQRIVTYRDVNGPFASLDELADVAGITPRVQATIAQYAVVR